MLENARLLLFISLPTHSIGQAQHFSWPRNMSQLHVDEFVNYYTNAIHKKAFMTLQVTSLTNLKRKIHPQFQQGLLF